MIFSPELQTLLATATDKADWASILNAALGASKRVRFFSGSTECRNVAMANTSVTTGNAGLVMPGAFANNTVNAASNLAAGNGTVRIEGNGHTVTLTLGLTGSGKQLELDADLAANGAIGNNGITLVPPAALPSAVGGGGDISALQVQMGPAGGALQALTIAEQVYSGMSVGFAGATQDRWRCNPITINGIDVTVFVGKDSDGRYDAWLYADWLSQPAPDAPDRTLNRQFAAVDLKISINGVAQTLWDGTDTYSFDFQRATALRWQSSELPWNVTTAHIQSLQAQGKMMLHKCDGVFAATKTANPFPENVDYKPFKTFGAVSQITNIGDLPRSTAIGGERDSVGLIHEWFARTVAEVGTHGNQAFATAGRVNSLRRLAETGAQIFSACGLINKTTNRFLDPGPAEGGPYVSHNANNRFDVGWQRLIQPGAAATEGWGDMQPSKLDCRYDNAHPQNLFAYYAYLLSNDPFHLACVQGEAIACVLATTNVAGNRGIDGELNTVGMHEERGYFWGLKLVVEAWAATPNDSMPKPFRNKAFFNDIVNNTLNLARSTYMDTAVHLGQTVISKKATNFWQTFEWFDIGNGYVTFSPYMTDYAHMTLAHARRMGYAAVEDVLLYYAKSMKMRVDMGGNWFYSFEPTIGSGVLGLAVAPNNSSTTLPYSTLAEFKAWYPGTSKVEGDINESGWAPAWNYSDPNHTYICMGALNAYKGLKESGLVTFPDWDPAAAYNAWMAHLLNPNNITNKSFYSKHMFNH